MATPNTPLWEVFIRSRNGLAHKHCGSLHASDATMALQAARDIYTRRGEGLSIWVVPSSAITASDPADKAMMFEPAESKIYLRSARRSRAYVTVSTSSLRGAKRRSNPGLHQKSGLLRFARNDDGNS
jgi:ring-1,2-phenylacetyl-CoA epoxidase subunit PaaB